MTLFNRKIIVEFETSSGNIKRLENISCKFKINKFMCAVMNEAQISIANLAREDIEYLTTYTSPFIAINQRKRIRVFANYAEQGECLLFDGDIISAIPTMPPDKWLVCRALSGAYSNSRIISKSITETKTTKEVAQEVSSWLELPLQWKSTIEKKIDSFYHSGGVTNLIKKLNDIGGIIAYEEDGYLKVVDDVNPDVKSGIRLLNKSSGMIGVPAPNPLGLSAKMLLDPSIVLGNPIQLESEIIPAANGKYWVYSLTHEGSSRENDFYTSIEARRFST